MSKEFRKVAPRDFFTLKASYQLLLLWLPVILGALSLGFGGYYFSSLLAAHFGIDPSAPIIRQQHAQVFAFSAICIFAQECRLLPMPRGGTCPFDLDPGVRR
jgi:hypothetical protein